MAGFRYSVKFNLQNPDLHEILKHEQKKKNPDLAKIEALKKRISELSDSPTSARNRTTQIRAYIRYDSIKVIVGTGKNIEPRYWNAEKNEPKQTSQLKDCDKLRNELEDIRDWLSTAFDHLTAKEGDYPEPEKLKELCLFVLKNSGQLPGKSSGQPKTTLAGYMQRLIDDTAAGRRTSTSGDRFAPGTIRHYNSAEGVINRYLSHADKKDIKFDEIDLQFYYDFREYAYQVENLSGNYFGSAVKFLKTVMTEAAGEGMHNNNIHNHKRFVKVNIPVDNIYLNSDQLNAIFKKDLSDEPRLDRVRDLFLVGCWTGLRFSDFTTIKAEDIDGQFIDIETQKTGERVAIPIHATVKSIMEKYAGKTSNSLPPPISNQKMNEYLKDLGKKLEFNEPITLSKAKGGELVKETKALHDLLSTHTARRSFASNMFRMGVPTMIIMAVTGHRTEASFMKYIKVSPREKAAIMAEIWQRQTMKIVSV